MKTFAVIAAVLLSAVALGESRRSIPFQYDVFSQLTDDNDCERYRQPGGAPYLDTFANGELQVRVLRHVDGMPLCNAVLANVHALRPSTIRIVDERPSAGHLRPWRVTIVACDGVVREVYQDVEVGYASGTDVEFITTAIRDGREAAREQIEERFPDPVDKGQNQ